MKSKEIAEPHVIPWEAPEENTNEDENKGIKGLLEWKNGTGKMILVSILVGFIMAGSFGFILLADLIGVLAAGVCFLLIKIYTVASAQKDDAYDSRGNQRKGVYGQSYTNETVEEIKKYTKLEVLDSCVETQGMPLGKVGDKIIAAKVESYTDNINMFVFGDQGSRKSRCFGAVQLLQAIVQGRSVFVSDPKNELYEKFASLFKNEGYEVRHFDTDVTRWNSDSWNPLADVVAETMEEQIADIVATICSNIFTEDDEIYYVNISNTLLTAVLYLVFETYERKEDHTLGKAYELLSGGIEVVKKRFDPLKETSKAKKKFNYLQGKAIEQAYTELTTALHIFGYPVVDGLTGTNEIEIDKIGDRKMAVFAGFDILDKEYILLSKMFIGISLQTIIRTAKNKEKKHFDVPVLLLLDEFPQLGCLAGFDKFVAVARSYWIAVTMIAQNLPQLQERYGELTATELLAGCPYEVLLGCNDTVTAKHFEEKSGTSTIEVSTGRMALSTVRLTDDIKQEMISCGTGQNSLIHMENFFNGEINTDKLVLYVKGARVVILEKMDYTLHPEALRMTWIHTKNIIPEWRHQKRFDNIHRGEYSLQEEIDRNQSNFDIVDESEDPRFRGQRYALFRHTIAMQDKYVKDGVFPNGRPFIIQMTT